MRDVDGNCIGPGQFIELPLIRATSRRDRLAHFPGGVGDDDFIRAIFVFDPEGAECTCCVGFRTPVFGHHEKCVFGLDRVCNGRGVELTPLAYIENIKPVTVEHVGVVSRRDKAGRADFFLRREFMFKEDFLSVRRRSRFGGRPPDPRAFEG